MSKDDNCCPEGTCVFCEQKGFTTTFYFDSHRVQIVGCATAVGEAEAALAQAFKGRIPKVEWD